jgi:DNA-binding winged helix-turn-helix (wHTH) protein/tetratricopeptide (TPR) repeat protein
VDDGPRLVRFGLFQLDLRAGELSRQGRPVRLQQQPFLVLKTLVDRPGELVTRDELRRCVWPDGITVDFDQSLNKSVTKLRDALGDSVASPRFIETLPKRGYRFIAPVVAAGAVTAETAGAIVIPARPADSVPAPPSLAPPLAEEPAPATASHRRPPLQLAFSMIGLAAIGALLTVSSGATKSAEPALAALVAPAVTTPKPIFAARDAYERGRLAVARRTDEGLRLGVEHFQRAIALSPRYADAYAGMADAWSLLASYGLEDPREGMPRARDAANRALALNPSLARAHASLGRTAMIFDWDWRTAEWHFGRAIALEPGSATTHQWFAYLLSASGRHDEAVAEARRAIAAEPLSLNTNTALGHVLYVARRYDEAAAHLERTLEIDPDFTQARRDLGRVRVQQSRTADAVAAFERVAAINPRSAIALAELAWARARNGETAAARSFLSRLDALRDTTYVPPDALALAHLGLGNRDQAVAWLRRAFTMRVATIAHLQAEPVWDALRDDPRVKEMVATVRSGLD